MAKCPFCEKEISHLKNREVVVLYNAVTTQGEVYHEDDDILADLYYCPECGAILFHRFSDALNFLRGGEKGEDV